MGDFENVFLESYERNYLDVLLRDLLTKPELSDEETKILLCHFNRMVPLRKRFREDTSFDKLIKEIIQNPNNHLEDRLLLVLTRMDQIAYPYTQNAVDKIMPVSHLIGEELEAKCLILREKHLKSARPDIRYYTAFNMMFEMSPETKAHLFAENFFFEQIEAVQNLTERGKLYERYASLCIEYGPANTPLEERLVNLWKKTVNMNPAYDYVDRAICAWFYLRNETYNETRLGLASARMARQNGLPVKGNNLIHKRHDVINPLYCLGRQRTSAQQPPGPPPTNIMDGTITEQEVAKLCEIATPLPPSKSNKMPTKAKGYSDGDG
ncbi:MAG: hypothetical protein AB7E52_02550 [Bdellovibrionales bacterium]